MLGHIPKRFAAVLAPKMDAGLKVSANVKEVRRRDGHLHLRINLTYANIPKSAQASVPKPKPSSSPKPSVRPTPPPRPRTIPQPKKTRVVPPKIEKGAEGQSLNKTGDSGGMPWWRWVFISLLGLIILGNPY